MSAQILNGKQLADTIAKKLKQEVAQLKKKAGRSPAVVNIMVGNTHSASAYASSQKVTAEDIGIGYTLMELPADIPQQELYARIETLNSDEAVDGIMIHKPVPAHIDYLAAVNCIDSSKDIEGINAVNIGKILRKATSIIPCTPAAVMAHIKAIGIPLKGAEVVIVGHSEIVGKPLALLLLAELATVTVCHIGTSEAGKLVDHVSRADILIVAVGKAGVIKGEWIKQDAVVIDVGINQSGDKVLGDVEFDTARQRAAYITPVPGGVGPVTAVMLMNNAVEAFKARTAAA